MKINPSFLGATEAQQIPKHAWSSTSAVFAIGTIDCHHHGVALFLCLVFQARCPEINVLLGS